MSEFVASNGITVRSNTEGVYVDGGSRLYKGQVDALREFFLAERDAELGRWRSKEHPEYVVYPRYDGSVRVVLEATGEGAYHFRIVSARYHDLPTSVLIGAEVAREYFAAHPERKPWHDAKPGEVWVIEAADWGTNACIVDVDYFTWVKHALPVKSEQITAGRRIWPEGN